MSSDRTSASLFFWLPSDTLLPEEEVIAYFVANPQELSDSTTQDGCLLLSNGTDTLRIADTLLFMVPGLCFDGLAELVQTGRTVFRLWSEDTLVIIDKADDGIAVSVDGDPPVMFAAGPFEAALLAAGERFTALVARLWSDRPDTQANLSERMEVARAALPTR